MELVTKMICFVIKHFEVWLAVLETVVLKFEWNFLTLDEIIINLKSFCIQILDFLGVVNQDLQVSGQQLLVEQLQNIHTNYKCLMTKQFTHLLPNYLVQVFLTWSKMCSGFHA